MRFVDFFLVVVVLLPLGVAVGFGRGEDVSGVGNRSPVSQNENYRVVFVNDHDEWKWQVRKDGEIVLASCVSTFRSAHAAAADFRRFKVAVNSEALTIEQP